jgi:hypothetical protein
MNPDPGFLSNAFVLLTVASAICSNLAVIVITVRGRPAVRREEFEDHKLQTAERFNGLAKKLNDSLAKVEQGQDEILRELRDFAKTLGRHEGKLEGLGK